MMNQGQTLDTSLASFSGHETFAVRYGWPKKGVDAILKDPSAFTREDAMVTLGVGKNMVRSIRHWCLTARLLEHDPKVPGNRGQVLRVTNLGRELFGPSGADPYLEDPGTLWLLHWLITTNCERATTWRWAFGYWGQEEFARDQLVADLGALIALQKTSRATESSLRRDVDTFLHTYVPTRMSKKVAIEDTLDCPLVELKLLRESPDERRYSFVRGPKPTLPDAIFAFAVAEYWERFSPSQESLSFEDLLYRAGAPGRIFKLDEPSLGERLERAPKWSRGALQFDQTAGLRQLLRRRRILPMAVLARGASTSVSAA